LGRDGQPPYFDAGAEQAAGQGRVGQLFICAQIRKIVGALFLAKGPIARPFFNGRVVQGGCDFTAGVVLPIGIVNGGFLFGFVQIRIGIEIESSGSDFDTDFVFSLEVESPMETGRFN
jgi:hypothetical protein